MPDTEAGLQQVFNNINNAISTYGAGVSALNLNSLISQLQTAVIGKMETAAAQAVGTLIAKFVPGFGMVQALLNGFGFLLTNKDSIAQVVTDIVNTVTEVVTNPQAFATDLVQVLDRSLPLLLKFAAGQLGLGNLPQQIQNAAQIIPTTVQQTLMTLISAIAKKVPQSGLGNPLFAGQLAPMVQFTYQGVMYDLWAAKQGSSSVIKLSTGGKLVAALSAANFTGGAISLFQVLGSDAQALLTVVARVKPLSTTQNQPLPDAKILAQEQNLSIKIVADENALIAPFEAGQCGLLSGCFRADAKLLTSEGWRRVDEIRAGELVAARDEFDPEGAIEWKRVEAKFERSGRILELVLNGQEIGTTPEHPFYVKHRGWTEAGALHAGDEVRTRDGWAEIGEVRDTGLYEKVYNVRVADFHTYFVGGDGCAVWAHNTACVTFDQIAITQGLTAYNTYMQLAFDARKKYMRNPGYGQKWKNGGGNIAMVSYTSGSQKMTLPFGSNNNPQGDAEQQALKSLKNDPSLNGSFVVNAIFTERSMCTDCQTYYKDQLTQAQVPTSKVIYVYYIIPYVEGQSGQVLLDQYSALGLPLPS